MQVVGDRWSLLVIRELIFGTHRFSEIQSNTGAPAATLSERLRKLEKSGVIARRRYSEHPRRYEYVLTPVGDDLTPVLAALGDWGARHATRARAVGAEEM
ncbi:winged helix-turn-helix transcriptional regulator [Streptomyces mirabilis]|uniref:winged helix-turn-helix transcriptional regulator n=1 Tax=Streptomyces mirabilis TaxID=68239 RepID=UPI003328D9E0